MTFVGSQVGRLLFNLITPGVDFHAGFVSGRIRPVTPPHTHDFFEIFYVLEDKVTHTINGSTTELSAGDLILVRADDCHSLTGRRFHLINVAFPADLWERYCRLSGREDTIFLNVTLGAAPSVRIPEAQREECAALFGEILRIFQQTPQGRPARQSLCRFWTAVLDYFVPHQAESTHPDLGFPVWLSLACRAMYEEENLRVGLPRFVEVSGVTRAHLTRTLKFYRQQTPTEFINEVRLNHAAMLLATTPADILDVAADCGFDNLSYFYRRFRRQFGKPPRVWRRESQCIVMPLQN
jgi:AraC-like DNA-binding protein/mannose-6-phosphate isomerase-like protein (cupin superfamily)